MLGFFVHMSNDQENLYKRVEAQLSLVENLTRSRHQTTVEIGISSIGIIGVSTLIQPSFYLKILIISLLLLCLIILWFDVFTTRKALQNSQNIIYKLLGEDFKNEAENIANKAPKWMIYFPEIASIFFTIIVVLIILLFALSSNSQHDQKMYPHKKEIHRTDRHQKISHTGKNGDLFYFC